MTNKSYNKLLLKLASANRRYKKLLEQAEEEFKKRYGNYPSDIDFDSWIDSYHTGTGYISAEDIEEEMKFNNPQKQMKKANTGVTGAKASRTKDIKHKRDGENEPCNGCDFNSEPAR